MSEQEIDKAVDKTTKKIAETEQIEKKVEALVKKKIIRARRAAAANQIGYRPSTFITPFKNIAGFFRSVVSASGQASSRRLIVLIISVHWIFTSFYVLFLKQEMFNQALIKQVLEGDFLIILVGLGFITGSGLVDILVQKFKAQTMNGDYGGYDEHVSQPDGDGDIPNGDIPAVRTVTETTVMTPPGVEPE